MTPTTIGLAAGIVTLIAGLSSLPRTPLFSRILMVALVTPSSRGWLHIHSWLCVVASLSLLIVGLKIWTLTLDEKNNIFAAYNLTSTTTIEALQERVSSLFLAHPNDSIIVAASSTVALLIS
jgi:membrane-associated phospholipid phosphatase